MFKTHNANLTDRQEQEVKEQRVCCLRALISRGLTQ